MPRSLTPWVGQVLTDSDPGLLASDDPYRIGNPENGALLGLIAASLVLSLVSQIIEGRLVSLPHNVIRFATAVSVIDSDHFGDHRQKI